jgi:P4 family phage/plasmid primase-like protien
MNENMETTDLSITHQTQTQTQTQTYKSLSDFLKQTNLTNIKKKQGTKKTDSNDESLRVTHTRIGAPELKVFGASFHIPKEQLPTFHRLYYDYIFVKGQKEYLTEKQLENDGPILVDLDFRYDYSVIERIHNEDHIHDLVLLYLEEIKELFQITDGATIPIYVMEKPRVNRVHEKNITKDGIHLVIGIKCPRVVQIILREKVLEKIVDVFDLPITNKWSDIIDEGIAKGCVNWQMFGSQKPGNDAYSITHYIEATLEKESEVDEDEDDCYGEWIINKKSVEEIDLAKNYSLVSAQYADNIGFEIQPKILSTYKSYFAKISCPLSGSSSNNHYIKTSLKNSSISIVCNMSDKVQSNDSIINVANINNYAELEGGMTIILESLKPNEQYIRETHEYTQILPQAYYEPGSHLKNRMVAFALKHTDKRLFLSWIMLRAKASDFEYSSITKLYEDWENIKSKDNGVTRNSIMYWAKQDAFEEYQSVKKTSIDYYVENTLYNAGDFDYAMVLYYMFKDKYVCTSLKQKTWYVFRRHKWDKDEGHSLRLAISKDLWQLYNKKQDEYLMKKLTPDLTEEQQKKIYEKLKAVVIILGKLKKTNDKNNIMREAMEIFFDNDFIKQMDSNPYLLCFKNGVYDFKNKEFRQGYPQDYITKTTNIEYTAFNPDVNAEEAIQITEFMYKLFPIPDLCRYMWDHLASTLIGIKKEHVFNIYRGSGSNGKSILTDLMSQCLGDYKGTVPITLVTSQRTNIGGTSSEVMQLKGIRYAVMQEPSKDAIINEGIMKELTGGDPIQARALYAESEIFTPQFSLVVCTNALFEIKSNDDGTWRRMKLVDFLSKFISEGEQHTDDTKWVFPKDKTLKEKLVKWAPVFIAMLIDRVNSTNGEVLDCAEVIGASNRYRQSQDCISAFINEKIEKSADVNAKVGKKMLSDVFKEWHTSNFGVRKIPKMAEVEEAMIKKFGVPTGKMRQWKGITLIYDDVDEFDADV